MMKVEMFNQWTATTINFEGDDTLYMRLSAENQVLWYRGEGVGDLVWVYYAGENMKLEEAWVSRGMRHGKS